MADLGGHRGQVGSPLFRAQKGFAGAIHSLEPPPPAGATRDYPQAIHQLWRNGCLVVWACGRCARRRSPITRLASKVLDPVGIEVGFEAYFEPHLHG